MKHKTIQERLLEQRQALIRLERSLMAMANFEQRSGRLHTAEVLRGLLPEVQAIRKDKPLPDDLESKLYLSVRDMKWEGKTR